MKEQLSTVTKHDIEICQDDERFIFAEGSSLLHIALGLGSLECTKCLIKSKVRYVQNKAGASEIHMLLLTKKQEVIVYAFQKLKDQLMYKFHNDTLLHLALAHNNTAIVKVLKEKAPNQY